MPATIDTVTRATTYTAPLGVTDVTLDGVSVLALEPVEIKVWPDGWGFISFVCDPLTGQERQSKVDGQHRTWARYGRIVVTLED